MESVVGEFAGLGVILEDFVVEDREVESESELDGVAGGKIDGVGLFVGFLGLFLDFFKLFGLGVFGDVAIVIANHLHEEGLGFLSAVSIEDAVRDHVDDLLAVVLELGLNLALVGEESSIEFRVLGVLLDGRDSAASGAFARNEVLEGDGEEIALVGVDGAALDNKDLLKEVDHILEALGLLSDAGKEDLFFDVVGGGHLCF